MKKIDFTHEDRAIIITAITATETRKAAEAAEKKAKADAAAVMEKLGKAFKAEAKTNYVYGTVQVQGKAKAVVYKETTAQGAIDWKAYAMALGGTEEAAEAYRKSDTRRETLAWATAKQTEELGL